MGSRSYNLFSCRTPDYISHGYLYQQRYLQNPLPTFIYSVEDIFIEKKICMVYGENTTVIIYLIRNGAQSSILKLAPLINFRDYHHNSKREYMNFSLEGYDKGIIVKPTGVDININIFCSQGGFINEYDCWFMNMYYDTEAERGLMPQEDHFIPGYFGVEMEPYEEKCITIIASIEDKIRNFDGLELARAEEERLNGLIVKACGVGGCKDWFITELIKASDNFIVKRESTNSKTIIAGYPWFTDWGRDTMIALPGLTLATKRFDDARDILYTFSKYTADGLLPNMFPDEGQKPPYNSVDAPLWYFEAVNKYIEYTGNFSFVKDYLYSTLTDIIGSYINGTEYNIAMDEDFLISAGTERTQLTWMDVKIGDHVVTPRHGKAVEINSLWYNALMVMAVLSDKFNSDGEYYREIAGNVRHSFCSHFWNQDDNCLFDVIRSGFRDNSIRPNQILALSLSFPIMTGDMAKSVLRTVWKELYTAYGLRTLNQDDINYKGIYTGSMFERDSAYHMGTVWTWPLGHFITAFVKVYGRTADSLKIAKSFIDPFRDHLRDACIGSISEIFDGSEPLIPRGCFAQAWSVAEILRVCMELGLWELE